MIVAVAVAVVLAIRLVVLVVVGHEVVEIEAVMGSHEVDAGPRPSPALVEEIARSRYAFGELGKSAQVPFPEPADSVPGLVVPLGPSRRKLADLITSRAD